MHEEAIVIGVGLLLTAALAYVLFGRNRRAPLRQAAAGPTPPATPAPTPTGAPVAPPPPAPSRAAQWWPRVRPVLKWAAAIAILFWLSPWQWFRVTPENRVVLTAIEPCTRVPAQEGKFSLTVTKDAWSPTYCFPEGGWDVRWVGEGHSRFQARVNRGSVYSFTPEHSDPVLEADGNIRTGSFKALGKAETITITVRRPQ